MAIIRSPQVASTRRTVGEPHVRNDAPPAFEISDEVPFQKAPCLECDAMEAMVKAARRDLEEALAELVSQQAEAKLIRDAAVAESFEAGKQQGREEALVEVGARSKALGDALAALQGEYHGWKRELDETTAVLVFSAVTGILGELTTEARDRAKVILGRILEQPGRDLVVKVSPDDANAVREALAHAGVEARVSADEGLMSGSCTVRTDLGELEARLDRQLEQLKHVLLSAVGGVERT